MNIRRWVKLALLFSAAVVLGIAIPVTLSYVFDITEPIVNTFVPPAGIHDENLVEILVDKTVLNKGEAMITPEGFTFVLENTATGEIHTATSNKDGRARFLLSFLGADAGSHVYKLTESNDGLEGVTYDTKAYTIRVDVAIVDGHAQRTLYVNDQLVETVQVGFTNIFDTEQIPDTGDHLPMAVFAVLLLVSGSALAILLKKRKAA